MVIVEHSFTWAASSGDRSCAVLQWLAESAQNVSISVGGENLPGSDSLHGAMRGWGVFHNLGGEQISTGELRSVF